VRKAHEYSVSSIGSRHSWPRSNTKNFKHGPNDDSCWPPQVAIKNVRRKERGLAHRPDELRPDFPERVVHKSPLHRQLRPKDRSGMTHNKLAATALSVLNCCLSPRGPNRLSRNCNIWRQDNLKDPLS
jgi:hypothetical protein